MIFYFNKNQQTHRVWRFTTPGYLRDGNGNDNGDEATHAAHAAVVISR